MKNLFKSILLVAFITSIHAQNFPRPDMVKVEGGTFNMGNDMSSDEKPLHSVIINSFSMAKYPTTVAEYRVFCIATNHSMPDPPDWGWNDNSPIVNVTYNDAVAYCIWLSKKYNINYSLPTEAEWEYAARGGNKGNGYAYSGGNDLHELGWYEDNSNRQTHSVGEKKPNELGLYDMSGNVEEWCMDWYDANYYSTSPTHDPKGPNSGIARVLRGGSWISPAAYCRVDSRYSCDPESLWCLNGFRVISI
jgi:formylglycine-generating enzyme